MLDLRAGARIRRFGGPSLLARLVAMFRTSGPRRVAEIRSALRNDDLDQAMQVAHSLKSSAANLGGTDVQAQAELVEALCFQGDGAGASEQFLRLERSMEALLAELHRLCPDPT